MNSKIDMEKAQEPTGSPIRSFEEQTPLERVLRAHLWQPMDLLRRCQERLPKLVKNKEYKEAGECQAWIIQANRDIEHWENILSLYEAERQSPND